MSLESAHFGGYNGCLQRLMLAFEENATERYRLTVVRDTGSARKGTQSFLGEYLQDFLVAHGEMLSSPIRFPLWQLHFSDRLSTADWLKPLE